MVSKNEDNTIHDMARTMILDAFNDVCDLYQASPERVDENWPHAMTSGAAIQVIIFSLVQAGLTLEMAEEMIIAKVKQNVKILKEGG